MKVQYIMCFYLVGLSYSLYCTVKVKVIGFYLNVTERNFSTA
jgi:hypothetical protein